jgi:hypothetical protein
MRPWLKMIPVRARVVLACSVGATFLAPAVYAQTLDEARANADALFREGQQLMTAGQMAAGCAKLEESQRIDPKLGRLLNVAYCHEHLGRTATAWSEYNQAAALALQVGQSDREAFARTQAGALARNLSFVRMDLTSAGDLSQVFVDGREIARDQWAIPFPIDPGDHTLTFAAVGRKTRTQTVTIASPGTIGIAVDALEPEAPEPAPSPSGRRQTIEATAEAPAREPSPSEARREGGGTRSLGWVIGAIGAGALGAGVGFGLRAMSLQSQADPAHCPNRMCDPKGKALIDDAQTAATISTIGFIAGGVGIGAGAWLILRSPAAPQGPHVAAYVAADRAGISMQGTW